MSLMVEAVPAQTDIDEIFLPSLSLRADGQHEEAAAGLREVLASYEDGDLVVTRAYEHLFTTLFFNPAPKAATELAETVRAALTRYPDLVVHEEYCPREVISLVEAVRLQMYGSLQITQPEGAEIILDGEPQGISPLLMEFIRVGDRNLTVTKEGFKDRHEVITIEPGARLRRDIELSSSSRTGWYIAGGVVVAGVIWALVSGPDDNPVPLAEPPPPPAKR